MVKILLTNSSYKRSLGCEYNKGSAAVAIATVKMLRDGIPDAQIASSIQFTKGFVADNGIRVIRNRLFSTKYYSVGTIVGSSLNVLRSALWALLHTSCPPIAKALVNSRELREFANADVIIDLGFDTYSDDYGIVSVIEHSKDILCGVFLKKPVVIWAQSLGPFRSKLTSWLVRFTLNRVALITVREEISLSHLRQLGVGAPPIHLTADPAFVLEPAPRERAKEILSILGIEPRERTFVGFTMGWTALIGEAKKSNLLNFMKEAFFIIRALLPERLLQAVVGNLNRFKRLEMSNYLNMPEIARIVDHLVEKLDAVVILVPHDYNPSSDDRLLLKQIIQRVKHVDSVKLLTGDYSSPEIKAVIGQCDIFVGGKMHANIAALSMHVPTIALQYGHKFSGIMKMLGQEKYICNCLSVDEVNSKIEEICSSKKDVQAELEIKMGIIQKQALLNVEFVKELLNSWGRRSGVR
jgi:colanic acid/amylovoran biosynthesis protein